MTADGRKTDRVVHTLRVSDFLFGKFQVSRDSRKVSDVADLNESEDSFPGAEL